MAPAVEAVNETGSFQKVPALNERILSSMSRRSVAAHPWHDLEIGIVLTRLDKWPAIDFCYLH